MTTEPTANQTTTTQSLTRRLFAALLTRSARRHSMAWMAAVVAVFAIAAIGSGAMPQGSRDARVKAKRSNGSPASKAPGTFDKAGPILAQTEFELTGKQVVVGPGSHPVPKNQQTALTTTLYGASPESLDPNYRVRGLLAGPSLTSPLQVDAPIGEDIVIPPLNRAGHHDVSALRIVDVTTGETVDSIGVSIAGSTAGNPIAVCTIDVIDQILVSEVDVHEMTYEEIVQAGISIDDDSYTYYNFALALGTSSNSVPLNIPVAFPPVNGPDPSPITPTVVNVGDAVDERPLYLVPVFLELEDPNHSGQELEFDGRPIKIPGVIIIPGQVGVLNQHFEATLVVANGAPTGSPVTLAVRDLTAMIELPDAGTPNDTSDDPLGVSETQIGGQVTTLPVHGLGPDGEYGTADDSTVLRPGEAGQASFLVQGLKEGLHTIDFNLAGTLEGLPIGPVTVKSKVPGSVLVRDRRFAMTFTHPNVVRDGQFYDFGVTLTNTSENVTIQQAAVTLSPAMISGAQLADGLEFPVQTLTAILPGESKTVKWRLKATTTGRVTASYGKVGGEIEAGLSLVMGVGDRNVPLSPDSLILPHSVDYLPSPFVEASRALLGQAWSVANAPPALIPAGVTRVSAQTVANRAGELGMAGIRTEFGEPLVASLGALGRDWVGEQEETPDEGFADVLRETVAGDAWFDALGVQLYQRLTVGTPAISPADMHREIAEAEMSRSPMVSALVSQASGTTALAGGRLIDPQGRITGFLATPGERAGQNRVAGAARLSNGDVAAGAGATVGQFVFASRVDNMPWTFELSGWSTGSVDVSLVVPATGRAANRVVFSGISVTPGSRHRVVARPFGSASFTLEVWQGSAWQSSGIAATVVRFEDPAPRLLGAEQLSPDLIKGGDKYGRLIGLMFSKPMSALQAEVASRYTIGGGELVETGELVGGPVGVSSATLNFGGRLVVVALKSPIGPYIHRTVTATGLVDTRGVPVVGDATADIHARVSPEGNPPGGWVTGRVLKATGEAVAGADVLYWTRSCSDDEFEANDTPAYAGSLASSPKLITAVKSDSSGRYSIDYVRNSTCGPVQIEARALDGNGLKKRTTPVNYNGQHLAVDLVFLARGSVQGTILRHDNTPAPYALVSIIPSLDITGTRTVQADAAGRYRADEVPVGTFSVKSVGSGPDYLASGLAAGAIEQPNGVATVNVTLQNTTGRVSGTARFAADPDRQALLFVLAYATIPGFGEHLVGFDVLDPDHSFEIGNIPIGSVRLEVSDDWRQTLATQTVILTEANPTISGVTFLLASLGAIDGRVIDDLGHALGNAVVRGGFTEVRTNAFGEYHIPDVQPGNHTLTATQIGTELSGSIEVTVQDGATVTGATIVIATPSTISGRVRIQRNGSTTPVSGAYVSVDGRNLAVTDAQGHYTLRNVIGNRAYLLRAVHPNGLIGLNQNIVVGRGETISRDVTFRPGRLHGTVLEPNGTPSVAVIAVNAMRPEINPGGGFGILSPVPVTPVLGASTGTYSVEDVNPGTYNVRASNTFFNQGRPVIKGGTIDFAEDETCDLTLVATFTGSVHGRITRPDGTPAGAGIDVTIGGGSLANVTVRTIADGTYDFPEVFSAGNYTITATDRMTGETKQTRVALRLEQEAEVNLKLLGRGGMRVHVIDGAGIPVTGGSVTIDGTEYPRNHGYSVISTGGGTVEFPGISEGPYAVAATWNGLSGRVSAFVANGTTIDVTVQLQASGTVTGRVFGPDGISPVGLADVELQIGGRIVGVAVTSDVDEDRGTFRFEHVPATSYRIAVFDNRSGRVGASGGTISTHGQTTYTQVRLVPTGTVTGVVTSNGSPSVHASVTIVAGESGFNSLRLTATTDSAGGFIFSGIPEGAFRLTATATGGLTGATDATLAGPLGQPLSTVANIALTPSVTVEGVVRALGNTDPVPGARVTLRVVNRNFTMTTLADGTYRIPFVPLGSIEVWANAAVGYDRGDAATVVADTPGATHIVNVEMDGIGAVEGVARTNTGAIVTAGTIKLVNDLWSVPGRWTTVSINVPVQPNGTFRVENAPAGAMSLRLTVPGDNRVGAATGAIEATQTSTLDVELESAGSVTGTVVLPDSAGPAPGSDVTVRLARAGKPTLNFYTHSNSQGVFQVDNVPLGAVTVNIEDASTGGVAVGSGALTANAQTIDVGTLTLDDDLIHVVSIDPVNGATSVPRNHVIRVTFSEPALPSSVTTGTLVISDSIYGAQSSVVTLAPDGLSATITPSAESGWREFRSYILYISTGVKDLAQRPMASNSSSTFTTIDETPPYAWLPWPRDGMTAISLTDPVELWYSEALPPDQNFNQIMRLAPHSDPTAYVAATVIQRPGESHKLLLTPTQPLEQFTTYVITANGARDIYGLYQVAPYSSSFKTKEFNPPVIDPIAIDGTTVTTSRPTIEVTYLDFQSGVHTTNTKLYVDGVVVKSGDTATRMTYTPSTNMTAGTHAVTATVVDVHGNSASRSASFEIQDSLPTISSFTIGGQPAVDAMTVAHTLSPAYSAAYSAASGINVGQTKLLIGQGGNTPAPVNATVGPTTLTYQTPSSLAAGDYTAELVVTDSLQHTASSGLIHFSINPEAPVLQTVTPNQGSQHGGTTVTLTGPRLLGLTGALPSVTVSGFAAQVISGSAGPVDQVTVVMPPGAPGLASLRIGSDRGSGLFADTYTYTASAGTPFAVEADTRLLWHLDEAASNATRIFDAGPMSIDGSIVSSGTLVDGRFGKGRSSLNLQGDDDFGQLNFRTGSFTVEGWVKTLPLPAGSSFLLMGRSDGSANAANQEFAVHLDGTGNLTGLVYPATGPVVQAVMPGTTFDVDDGAWHAVAMVVNRETGKLELYVDGVMRKDADLPPNFGAMKFVNSYRFRSGYRSSNVPGYYFPGTIDELRVSSTAHTAVQIASVLSGGGAPVITRVSPTRFIQRGGTSELVVDGYGLSTATVTATGPFGEAIPVQVQARSATTLRLHVSAGSAVALGQGQMTVTAAEGSAVTTLTVVDQMPYAVEADTRLLWHLDETANGPTPAIDAGALSIDGYIPSGSVSVDGRFGKGRAGLYVRGDDDLGQLAFGSASFTVEGWIKTGPLTAGSSYLLMGRSHAIPYGTAQEYGIHLDGAGNLTALIYPATGSVVQAVMPATAFDVDDNAWHAVAMVVNRETSRLELYVDGVMRTDAVIPTDFGEVKSVSGYRFNFGYRSSSTGASYFPGTIDEVRVSSIARSATQVAASVNGSGSPVITRVAPTRFVSRGGTAEIVVEGYGFSNADVTAAGPDGEPLDVQVVTQSSTRLQLLVSAGKAVALGEGQLTVTSTDGSGVTPLTVVDQTAFAVEGDTRLLWHLDETATGPTQAIDAGPLSIDGYIPSGSVAVNGRFGMGRSATYVQGNDDLGQLTFGTGSFTAEGWVKTGPLPVAGTSNQLFGRSAAIPSGTALEYGVHLDAGGNLKAVVYPATGPAVQAVMPATAFNVDDGGWHAVAMVVNREMSKLELYVDGMLRADADVPAGFGPVKVVSGYRFRLGDTAGGAGGTYFAGTIDEVRVSSTAHSAAQILASAEGTTTPTVVRALPYAVVQRGAGTAPLALTGYGLLGLTVTANQPDVVVDVVSSSADRCDLLVDVPSSTPLGPMQLTLTDAHGHSSTTTIEVAEQKAFVNANQTSAETGLLWHLDETGNGNVVVAGSGDPMPLVLGGTASTGSVATAGRFAPAGAPQNTGARGNLSITADSDSGNLAFGAGSFTVETWVKSAPLPAGTRYQLVGRSTTSPSTSTQEYSILLDAKGKLTAQIYQSTTVFVQAAMSQYDLGIDDNAWHYVAMVVNRTTGKLELYVDGVLRAETAIPGTFGSIRSISGSRVQVGLKADAGGVVFPGAIDEVRVLRYAAPAAQIRDTWLGISTAGKYATAAPPPGPTPPPVEGDSTSAVALRFRGGK